MSQTKAVNQDQAEHWNDRAGRTWAELGEVLDGLLAPFAAMVIDALGDVTGKQILDVGCGAGALTLAAARAAGPLGGCLGVDISAPLIDAARARATAGEIVTAEFVEADAQTHDFGATRFDAIVSRFGVMFFADPLAAFRNLHASARPGARLAFVAWRRAAENAFMTTAERAAAELLPDLPTREEEVPGQFAFGRRERVEDILAAAGWRQVELQPVDVECVLPRVYLATYVTRMGPLGALLPTLPDDLRSRLAAHAEAAFEPYVEGDEVRFTAACWLATARA